MRDERTSCDVTASVCYTAGLKPPVPTSNPPAALKGHSAMSFEGDDAWISTTAGNTCRNKTTSRLTVQRVGSEQKQKLITHKQCAQYHKTQKDALDSNLALHVYV